MTTPLSKLRTYNRPTNGLAWVREAERLLAEAYERPVDAATRGDAPLLPPGATEFESDGMRALRFTDTDGDLCEVRASARQEYQVKFHGQAGGWATLDSGCMSDGDPDSPAFPWLRSVWAEMREKERQPVSLKAAKESALQALSDAEERLAEERESEGPCDTCEGRGFVGHPDDPAGKCRVCNGSGYERESDGDAHQKDSPHLPHGQALGSLSAEDVRNRVVPSDGGIGASSEYDDWDPLIVLEEFDRLYSRNTNDEDCLAPKKAISGIKSERARTAVEIERLRARVGELESARDDWRECANRLTIRDIELTKGAVVDADRIASLRAERDGAIRERDEAKRDVKVLTDMLSNSEQMDVIAVLNSQKVELEKSLAEERARMGVVTVNENKLHDHISRLAARISELEQELSSANQRIKAESAARAEWSEATDDAQQKTDECRVRISELESQLAEVRGMYEGLRGGFESWMKEGRMAVSANVAWDLLARFPAIQPTESPKPFDTEQWGKERTWLFYNAPENVLKYCDALLCHRTLPPTESKEQEG